MNEQMIHISKAFSLKRYKERGQWLYAGAWYKYWIYL